jgi:hypothetical protein
MSVWLGILIAGIELMAELSCVSRSELNASSLKKQIDNVMCCILCFVKKDQDLEKIKLCWSEQL